MNFDGQDFTADDLKELGFENQTLGWTYESSEGHLRIYDDGELVIWSGLGDGYDYGFRVSNPTLGLIEEIVTHG